MWIEQESVFFLAPPHHLKTGYLGLRALTVMYKEITQHIFKTKKDLKGDKQALMEQVFSGFLHKAAIV